MDIHRLKKYCSAGEVCELIYVEFDDDVVIHNRRTILNEKVDLMSVDDIVRILEKDILLQHFLCGFACASDNTFASDRFYLLADEAESYKYDEYRRFFSNSFTTVFPFRCPNGKRGGFECHRFNEMGAAAFSRLAAENKLYPQIETIYRQGLAGRKYLARNAGIDDFFYAIDLEKWSDLPADAAAGFPPPEHTLQVSQENDSAVYISLYGWPHTKLFTQSWFTKIAVQCDVLLIYGRIVDEALVSKSLVLKRK